MTLIYSVIFWFFLKAGSCERSCPIETTNHKEFSLNVAERVGVEAGDCIMIPYKLTFQKSKVTAPYKKTWFEGAPSNTVTTTVVSKVESETEDTFRLNGLPRGEYDYGLKLEWGCNLTYVFPKRVHISVSAFTRKPWVYVPPMTEGQVATLRCNPHRSCSGRPQVHWKWTKADGQSSVLHDYKYSWHRQMTVPFIPTAEYHNSNITCVAQYDYGIAETTVTLTVKFSPRILKDSRCVVEGKLLVCVCVSRGNPLPPITWPSASLTDYSVSSSSSIQTVNSTITMPAAGYHNTTVTCISSNELGRAEIIIPVQNSTEKHVLGLKHKSDAAFPWIIVGVSVSLNLVLLTTLIIFVCKRSQPKEVQEEMNTYVALNRAAVEQPYGVLSLRNT